MISGSSGAGKSEDATELISREMQGWAWLYHFSPMHEGESRTIGELGDEDAPLSYSQYSARAVATAAARSTAGRPGNCDRPPCVAARASLEWERTRNRRLAWNRLFPQA